jgi:chromosome segregation ATPase
MERKNSLVSMVTQTCDREMVGRSEFIEIPVDQHNLAQNINNSSDINFDSNIVRLSDNKQTFPISKKNTGFKDNFEMSNFSNINRITDYSASQNFREKTENVIQMQNVQRELDNEIEMNKRLQGQIENYKNEFNNLREELVKKSDIINELQQKISKLEKDLFLQGNQLIEAESKPSQEHYEDIVNNYEEMKKNFDKAVERIKFLSDENAELKEKNMRLEESIKKLKKEKVQNINKTKNINKKRKSFNTYQNEFENENENEYYNQNEENLNEDLEHNSDIPDNKKNSNNFNEDLTNERNDNYNNEEVKKEMKEKRSIIPEDNDIFGTRGVENNKKKYSKT